MTEEKKELLKGSSALSAKSEQFQGIQTLQQAEHAAIQVAAAAKAEVESAFIMAMKMPRNREQSRIEILDSCKSLKFAEKVLYKKPIGAGKFVEGPSIRFAEEAVRTWGNVKIQHYTIYEDDMKRISMVNAIDLQKNLSYSKQIIIEKTVERKNAKGRDVVGERLNSYNEKISIVKATDDEVRNKEAAMLSKEIRNSILRLIPQDIIDEAVEATKRVIMTKAKDNPQAEKRKILDAFNELGIKPLEIEKYTGHGVDTITPAEIVDLRTVYTSIKDGQSTWKDYIEKEELPKEEGSPESAEISTELFQPGDEKTHTSVKDKVGK